MSRIFSNKSFCSLNTIILTLYSTLLLSDSSERNKDYNTTVTRQRPQNFLKTWVRSTSCPLRTNYLRMWFKNISETHWKRNLLTASEFGFRTNHSWHFNGWYWRNTQPHISTINTRISTDALFLDVEKGFNATWHSGLLHKFSELEFSSRLIC
jgi:hypothetical protein